jgi:hypothetical protein
MPGSLLFYFCPLIPRIGLLVFLLVSAAIDDENRLKFKWLRTYAVTGQGGAQAWVAYHQGWLVVSNSIRGKLM